jgi:hypothetical protein
MSTATPSLPSHPPAHRLLKLVALLVVCAIVYGFVLSRFELSRRPQEVDFSAASGEAQLDVYLQPVSIDPANSALQIKISVVPDATLGDAADAVADRDLVLKVRRGKQVEHVPIRANQPMPEVTFEFDLEEGDIRDYPLDRYLSDLTIGAEGKAEDGAPQPLKVKARVWEGLIGFNVKARQLQDGQSGALRLQFDLRRTGAASFFGLAIYAAMTIMACCALTIGSLVSVGFRKVEVSLAGVIGAIIFALPALRNALPGAPPLGVRADVLIFFWAELAAIIALCLVVVSWVLRGARQ